MSQAASLARWKGIVSRIDEVIDAYTGWPKAFSTK